MSSKVVIALQSPSYYGSKYCRAEIEAADEAGVPIVPCYAGSDYTAKQITALRRDSSVEKQAAIQAVFREKIIDVHNPAHAGECARDLQEKIVDRFCC